MALNTEKDVTTKDIVLGLSAFCVLYSVVSIISYYKTVSKQGDSAKNDLRLLGSAMAKWGAIALIAIGISWASIWGSARLGGETGGWIAASIVGIAFMIVANHAWETRCPNCGKRFVAVTEHSENVGHYQESIKKTQAMNIRSSIRDGGQVIGQVDVPVTENRVVDVINVQKRCKSCSHRWSVTAKQRRYFQ